MIIQINNRAMLFSPILLMLASLLVFQIPSVADGQEGPNSCHLREFDLCLASAVVFVQQPSNGKVSEADIEKQCTLFKETEECIKAFDETCMGPMQREMVLFMSGGVLRYMQEYCKKGSALRKSYLKHGDCTNRERKNTKNCMIDFQAAVEKSSEDATHWKDRNKVMCCALDRFKKCQAKIIEPACGKEAVEVGNTVMKGIFSRAATVTCEKYKAESTVCKNLLPPTGTVPKGAKSKSVLSKLLSTMTQA